MCAWQNFTSGSSVKQSWGMSALMSAVACCTMTISCMILMHSANQEVAFGMNSRGVYEKLAKLGSSVVNDGV